MPLRVLGLGLTAAFAVLLGRAQWARSLPDLAPWHRERIASEFTARDAGPETSLADYLAQEERVFAELERKLLSRLEPSDVERAFSRYAPAGANDPTRFERNWNRSYVLEPGRARGAALLLHGLSDSPYSLRAVGELLHDEGFLVLGLRLPGHGTVPAGLCRARWQDWLAAARVAARHLAERLEGRGPLWVVGYSTGGALALHYALDALDDPELARADQLVLVSPAIAVTPFAALARLHRLVSWVPAFEKFRWLEVEPEYDPYKYNSFPKFAGEQSHGIARALDARLRALEAAGRGAELPPAFVLQSLADATVRADATIELVLDRLRGPSNELVLFDLNRALATGPLLASDPSPLLSAAEGRSELSARLTVVTNAAPGSLDVVARSRGPGDARAAVEPLGLSFPADVFSLSHVALPFAPDDWLYGVEDPAEPGEGPRLARIMLRGEAGLLAVAPRALVRLRYDPFFPYVARRLRQLAREG